MTRRRKIVVGVSAALLFVGTAGLWFTNTASLDFPIQDEPLRLAPGETAEVDLGGACPPNTVITYKPTRFGRWQQTHVNGQRDLIAWWSIRSREYFSTLECRIGPWPIELPEDVIGDRVALCGLGTGNCVEIRVDRAD